MIFSDALVRSSLNSTGELGRAWTQLNYDIVARQGILTPPSTPAAAPRRLLTTPSRLSPPPSFMFTSGHASKALDRRSWQERTPSAAMPAFAETENCADAIAEEYDMHSSQSAYPQYGYECCCYQDGLCPRSSECNKELLRLPRIPASSKAVLFHGRCCNSYATDSLLRPDGGDRTVQREEDYPRAVRSPPNPKRKAPEYPDGDQNFKRAFGTPLNEEKPACQVQGILSRPGCRDPKYTVTAEELERRVGQPECLSKVDMIAYVRLAKNSARMLLDKHGVKTNQENQRSEHTILSKVCEAEAKVLAEGIRDINFRYFPGGWLARRTLDDLVCGSDRGDYKESMLQKLKENEVAEHVLLDLYFNIKKRKDERELVAFDQISHSFGIRNIQDHILFILNYLEEEKSVIRGSL